MRVDLLKNKYFLKVIRDIYIKSSDFLIINILYLIVTKNFIFNRYEDLRIFYPLALKEEYIYILFIKLFITIYSALNFLYFYFSR